MVQHRKSAARRYGVALLAVALAVATRYALAPWLGYRAPYMMFYAAVTVAGWYGGVGPALVALVLGGLMAVYLWIPPQTTLVIETLEEWVHLYTFVGVSLLITGLNGAMHRARQRLELTAASLHAEVAGRRRAENDLKEKEGLLRLVLETGQDASWEWDAATGTMSFSDNLYQMIALPPTLDQPDAVAARLLVQEEDWEKFHAASRRSAELGLPLHVEVRIKRPRGEYGHFLVRGRGQRAASGEVLRFAGLVTDLDFNPRLEEVPQPLSLPRP